VYNKKSSHLDYYALPSFAKSTEWPCHVLRIHIAGSGRKFIQDEDVKCKVDEARRNLHGKQSIQKAFEDTWKKIKKEKYSISNLKWLKTGYRNAICGYIFKSNGIVNSKLQVYNKGRGRNRLRRINCNWRIIHEYLSKLEI
jgi:hypothetical protein